MKNMKRFTKTAALIVSMVSFGGTAFAQSQCKVALVNMEYVITRSDEGKELSAKLDAKVAEWIVKADAIQEEISNARQKLRAQAETADRDALAELNGAVRQKVDELELVRHAAQKDKSEFREQILTSVSKSASEIAKQIATERVIDSVVDASSPMSTAPINGDAPNCNITSEVTRRMNAKFSSADSAK